MGLEWVKSWGGFGVEGGDLPSAELTTNGSSAQGAGFAKVGVGS